MQRRIIMRLYEILKILQLIHYNYRIIIFTHIQYPGGLLADGIKMENNLLIW